MKGLCEGLKERRKKEGKRERRGERNGEERLEWGEVEEVWGSGMNFLPVGGEGGGRGVFGGLWKVVKKGLGLPIACSFVCSSCSSSLSSSSSPPPLINWVMTSGGTFTPPSRTLFCDPSSSLSLFRLTTTTPLPPSPSPLPLSFLHPLTHLSEKVAETIGIQKITFSDLVRFYNASVTQLVGVTKNMTPNTTTEIVEVTPQNSACYCEKIRDNVEIVRDWLCFLHRELVRRGGGEGGGGFGSFGSFSVLSSVFLPVESEELCSHCSSPRIFLHSLQEGVCYLEGERAGMSGEEGTVADCLSRPLVVLSSLFEDKKSKVKKQENEKEKEKDEGEEKEEEEEEEEKREEARLLVRRCGVKVLDVHALVERDILLPLSSWTPSSPSSSSPSPVSTSSESAERLIFLTQMAAIHYKKCQKCQKKDSFFHKLFKKKLFVCVKGDDTNTTNTKWVAVCDGRVIFSSLFDDTPPTKPPTTTTITTTTTIPPSPSLPPPPQAIQAFLPYSLSPLYLSSLSPPPPSPQTMVFFFENIGVRWGLPLVRRVGEKEGEKEREKEGEKGGEEGEEEWDCPPVRKLVCSLGLLSASDSFRLFFFLFSLFFCF